MDAISLVYNDPEFASGYGAHLKIHMIPMDYYRKRCYRITEYDGMESIRLLKDKYNLICTGEVTDRFIDSLSDLVSDPVMSDSDKITRLKDIFSRRKASANPNT